MKNINSNWEIIIMIIISAMIISSCEPKFIEVDINSRDKKLVVHSFINPASPFIIAKISHSLSTFSNEEFDETNNATVIISSTNSIDTLIYTNGLYQSEINPVSGEYQIFVSHEGFESVNSVDIIPENIQIISLDTMTGFHNGEFTSEFELKFSNTINVKEFIIIELLMLDEYWEEDYNEHYPVYISSEDPIVENIKEIEYGANKILFNDQNFDGQEYIFRFFIPYKMFDGPGQTMSYFVRAYSCSENYYQYIKTYDLYRDANDNPFAQPVQIHSNIENGIGIFAAYRINEIEI